MFFCPVFKSEYRIFEEQQYFPGNTPRQSSEKPIATYVEAAKISNSIDKNIYRRVSQFVQRFPIFVIPDNY